MALAHGFDDATATCFADGITSKGGPGLEGRSPDDLRAILTIAAGCEDIDVDAAPCLIDEVSRILAADASRELLNRRRSCDRVL